MFFSHANYFDELLSSGSTIFVEYFPAILTVTPAFDESDWNYFERSAYVHLKDRLISFPFEVWHVDRTLVHRSIFNSQHNINALDTDDQLKCLHGLVDAQDQAQLNTNKPANFEEWLLRVMGSRRPKV